VSVEAGEAPVWAPDGRILYFVQRGALYSVSVSPRGETFNYGTPTEVVPGSYFSSSVSSRHATYDIAAGGRRFVTSFSSAAAESQPVMVFNWIEELRDRMRR
jgi:hypothetical protein